MGLEGDRKAPQRAAAGGGVTTITEIVDAADEPVRRRRLGRLACALACVAALCAATTACAETDSPAGLWKTVDDKSGKERALVRIVDNNGVFEGTIEKI